MYNAHGVTFGQNFECNCGETFTSNEAFKQHHLEEWNMSPYMTQERRDSVYAARTMYGWNHDHVRLPANPKAEVVECTTVACHNKGNGRECYHLVDGPGYLSGGLTFYGLSYDEASRLKAEGGTITNSFGFSTC